MPYLHCRCAVNPALAQSMSPSASASGQSDICTSFMLSGFMAHSADLTYWTDC